MLSAVRARDPHRHGASGEHPQLQHADCPDAGRVRRGPGSGDAAGPAGSHHG